MSETRESVREPAAFLRLREYLTRGARRAETTVTEIPSPSRVAPFSIALAADVSGIAHGVDSDLGTGRFVALYDPEESEGWGGPYRIVSFAQAPLEPEIGVDEFVADVTWSWLVDALSTHQAAYTSASGTATKIISRGYGELAAQGDGAQLELRASWSPLDDDLIPHVQAWEDIVGMLAGLPPASDGVALLAPRRLARE